MKRKHFELIATHVSKSEICTKTLLELTNAFSEV